MVEKLTKDLQKVLFPDTCEMMSFLVEKVIALDTNAK